MLIKFEPFYFSTEEFTHLTSLVFEDAIPGISQWRGGQTKHIPESLMFSYDYDLTKSHRLVDDLLTSPNFRRVDAGDK